MCIRDRNKREGRSWVLLPKKKSWHRDVFRDSVPCPILLSKAFHHAVRKGMLCLDFDEDTKIYMWPYCYGLVVLNKIKSLGLLGHVSFRIHCCTSTSCLSNGWSCRDLACLSCMPKWHCWQKSTHLKVNFLLICFQQLFTPDIATQRLPLAE